MPKDIKTIKKEELEFTNVEFVCPMCGATHYLYKLPVSKVNRAMNRYDSGEYIQDIFPELDEKDREKFITGYCDECQEAIFNGGEY